MFTTCPKMLLRHTRIHTHIHTSLTEGSHSQSIIVSSSMVARRYYGLKISVKQRMVDPLKYRKCILILYNMDVFITDLWEICTHTHNIHYIRDLIKVHYQIIYVYGILLLSSVILI